MVDASRVTVVIPSMGRAEQLDKCLAQLLRTAPDIEIITAIPADDLASRKVVDKYITIDIVDQDPDGLAIKAWNDGAARATGDYLVNGADDVWFTDGWLEAALEAMKRINGNGMVGLNTLDDFEDRLATHYMVSRAYAVNDWGGVLFFPQYRHFFTDNEANHRARRDGCFTWAKDAVVEHRHPEWGKAETDFVYERTDGLYMPDQETFEARMEAGFPNDHKPAFGMLREPADDWGKVCVGQRIYNAPDPDFHHCMIRMALGGMRPGDQILEPIIGKPAHLAANHLVRGFLNTTCDSLLLVDDDMIFDADALELLRSNPDTQDYDVVFPFCTHRTIPPHAVVMTLMDQAGPPLSILGEQYGTLKHVEDNAVIDVDAVGLAFTLVKRHVFESMFSEYGALYTSWFNWGAFNEGEDIRFSRRCRQNGFSLAVDTNVKLGHVGRYTFTWDDHQRWLMQEKQNG